MTTAATIAARLTLDQSDYDSGLDSASSKASTFQDKMSKAGKTMAVTGGIMTAAVTMPIVNGFQSMITSASDLNESANAMNVVFTDSGGTIEDFAQTSAESIGMAKSDFYQLAAVQGAALKNYGMSNQDAADETITLAQRAADMASIFNTTVPDAMTAIGSMMRGETEPIKRYGVSMSQAAVEAKALEMGLIPVIKNQTDIKAAQISATEAQEKLRVATAWYGSDSLQAQKASIDLDKAQQSLSKAMEGSTGEMTPAIKAQASLALFYQQTDQFAGDFANTSDQLANGSRILSAQLKDEAASLGTQLLPYVLKGVQFLRELLVKFQALTPEQKKWIMVIIGVVAVIGPLLLIIGSVITAISALIPIITAVAGVFTFPLIAIILAVIAVIALLYYAWQTNFGGIREIVASVIQWVSDFIAGTIQFIHDLTTGQLGEMSAIWGRTMNAIKTVVNLVLTNIKLYFAAWRALMSGDFTKFGQIMRQIWDNTWKAMLTIVKTAWANIKSAISIAVQGIKNYFSSINWGEVGTNMITAIANGIANAGPMLIQAGMNVFGALGDFLSGFFGGGSTTPGVPDNVGHPGRAFGGNVSRGRPYMVGEVGPELFVPSGNGTIIPNNKLGNGSGTKTVNNYHPQITIYAGNKSNPRDTMRGLI